MQKDFLHIFKRLFLLFSQKEQKLQNKIFDGSFFVYTVIVRINLLSPNLVLRSSGAEPFAFFF